VTTPVALSHSSAGRVARVIKDTSNRGRSDMEMIYSQKAQGEAMADSAIAPEILRPPLSPNQNLVLMENEYVRGAPRAWKPSQYSRLVIFASRTLKVTFRLNSVVR